MTEKTKPVNIRETINVIVEAREKWFKENDETKLREMVQRMLDKNIVSIVQQILGFERETGYRGQPFWRIDHCNGREAAVTKLVKDEAIAHLKKKAW